MTAPANAGYGVLTTWPAGKGGVVGPQPVAKRSTASPGVAARVVRPGSSPGGAKPTMASPSATTSSIDGPVRSAWFVDTGPILERDLAQRAGLGWIGKNTCLINPAGGSYFLLAEIFLDLELEPDRPFTTDQCGTCTRCLDACPTGCILSDRTLDAGRCISYLTIELKEGMPPELRPLTGDWVFGCDICQMVCPWNRFASPEGDPVFRGDPDTRQPEPVGELALTTQDFNRKFKDSPVRRAKRRGYERNVAVALGNIGSAEDLPALQVLLDDPDPMVREHALWATDEITRRSR